jgi:uncharacterized membrane protein YesL
MAKFIDKEPVQKSKFMNLIDILFNRIWDLSKINFLAILFYLPALYAMLFLVTPSFVQLPVIKDLSFYAPEDVFWMDVLARFSIGSILMTIPLVVFGPAAAGLTWLYRAIVNREAYFIWSDFWAALKKFFFKSLVISIIDIAVMMIIGIALNFYLLYVQDFIPFIQGSVKILVLAIILIFLLLFTMMHLYIYQLLIQYNLGIRKLYHHSFVFAVLRFFPNLLVIAVCTIITVLPFNVHFMLGSGLFIFLMFGVTGTIINYYSWPAIRKHYESMTKK